MTFISLLDIVDALILLHLYYDCVFLLYFLFICTHHFLYAIWCLNRVFLFLIWQRANIHVVVPATYMATFKDKLIVDHTYIVSNFNVQENDLVFKPSSHKYMVKFTRGTYVNDVNKHVIPPKTLNFNSFADIMTDRLQKDVLIGDL
ncbi:hypothetical protein KIW84_040278 [Lathyrus oleraceus]|uniref:Replication protein A 70 kDa DNA-binding subunit B/D first OB fold domain-containing protein n=1 Tax=Pisum sativum TaxID=3888 RepID=A0A9D4X9S7_PEA|nr:hypothetical protein KIW84_040278 [Pisum sativum]